MATSGGSIAFPASQYFQAAS